MLHDDAPTVEFTSADQRLSTNDQKVYDELREAGAVVWSTLHGGYWVATDHAACRAVVGDPESFSSATGVSVPRLELFDRGIPIFALEADDPNHRDQRAILTGAIGTRPSEVPADLIETITARLLASIDWSGPVDLKPVLCDRLPLEVIWTAIGADPEFMHEMKTLVDALVFQGQPVPGVSDPAARIQEIAEIMVERRRGAPTDDWIARLAHESVNGKPLQVNDMVAAVVSLITGGHHSTSRGLASLFARILTEPNLKTQLIENPENIPAAVEETLRLHTPLPAFSRQAILAAEVAGADITPGEDILCIYAAANRDPKVFPNPDDFRLDRQHRLSLAFGFGPHRCVGIYLARAELRIAVQRMLTLAPDLELVEPINWRGPAEPTALHVRSTLAGAVQQ